jgi:predicted dehydrogenase
MKTLDIGIFGLGAIAERIHLPILSRFPDARLKAAAEVDRERGARTAERWKIPEYYEDGTAMYEAGGIDAVFICLPNMLHAGAVRGALDHGIHVFCEKPLGTSSDRCHELVRLAAARDLRLAVGYNRRLHPNYRRAAEIVKSLRLGAVLQTAGVFLTPGPYASWIPRSDWFFNDKYGVLYDSGSHLIDLVTHILHDPITHVQATGASTMHGISIYDNIACSFRTAQGALGTLMIGWKASGNYDVVQVHGTGGALFASPMQIEIRHGSYGPLAKLGADLGSIRSLGSTLLRQMAAAEKIDSTYLEEDRGFLDAILSHTDPLVTGQTALEVLEIIDAIKRSLDSGNQEKVIRHAPE